MDYSSVANLKQRHPAWRLLSAESAPLIVGFLFLAFIRSNARSVRQDELVSQLDDYLYEIKEHHGARYPRSAQQYLDAWANAEAPYLRKYYPSGSDEPEYDLTPATETVIEWLQGLGPKQFVGTESRLLTVFQLLRDIVQATETDPLARIAELERRKAEIDREISRLQAGEMAPYSATQVKERFLQVEEMARRLLSDFRQVEENFRRLDRATRERIATSPSRKGALLDEIFNERTAITDSDQGQSFKAFWAFLLTPARHEELSELVKRVLALDEVRSLSPDELLPRIKYHLMEAGEKVQRTSGTLVEQLRKYLDDKVWLENKRIVEIIQAIEKQAVGLRQAIPKEWHLVIDDFKADIDMPLARPLFKMTEKVRLDSRNVALGAANFVPEALFNQHHVDEEALRLRIRRLLNERSQLTLAEVVEVHPIKQGLSELVAYFHIASKDPRAMIDTESQQQLVLATAEGSKTISVPTVIFTRQVLSHE